MVAITERNHNCTRGTSQHDYSYPINFKYEMGEYLYEFFHFCLGINDNMTIHTKAININVRGRNLSLMPNKQEQVITTTKLYYFIK